MSNIDKPVVGMRNVPQGYKTRTHALDKRRARRRYRREVRAVANKGDYYHRPSPKWTDWDVW